MHHKLQANFGLTLISSVVSTVDINSADLHVTSERSDRQRTSAGHQYLTALPGVEFRIIQIRCQSAFRLANPERFFLLSDRA